MSFSVNIYYTGEGDNARRFARDMVEGGIVDQVRALPGNLRYEYFMPLDDPQTVLLIDTWADQEALDSYHASPLMGTVANLRDKYGLRMRFERYVADGDVLEADAKDAPGADAPRG